MRSLFRGGATQRRARPVRAAALLAALWAGTVLALGFVAAPLAFTALPRDVAGRYATALFSTETRLALAAEVVLLLLVRSGAESDRERGRGPVWLILGAVFVTVVAGYALPPAMESARAGHGMLSFGALHGAAATFYGVKAVLALLLAWRLNAT